MENNLRQYYLRHGLIFGFLQVIFYYLLYFVNRQLLASFLVGFLFLLFIIIYPIAITIRYRSSIDGYITFKDSFQVMFFTMLIRGVITTFFTILLFSVIDPDLAGIIKAGSIESTTEMMQRFGASEEKINKAIEGMGDMEKQFSTFNQMKGFLFGSVIAAIFSLVVSLIIKKEKPLFENIES